MRVRAGATGKLELTYMRSYGSQWADATVWAAVLPPGGELSSSSCAAAASRAIEPAARSRGNASSLLLKARWADRVSLDAISAPLVLTPRREHCVTIALVPGSGSAFKLRGARAC